MNSRTNFRPPPSYLLGAAAQNLGWTKALGDLSDNANDHNATKIDIVEGPLENKRYAWLEIRDDGSGCPDPVIIPTYGERGERTSAGLGRYGIGGPEAIMDIGGLESTVDVASVFEGVIRHVRLPWRELLNSQDWTLPNASWEGGRSSAKGTIIHIGPVRRTPIPKHVRAQLGYIFAPYLKGGGQILFHRDRQLTSLERWELPPLDEVVEARIAINGKAAYLRAGVVPEGTRNEHAGITIAHKHRVIEEASGSCCGDYGYQRVAGVVMLDRGWELNKNKDGINEGAAELYAAVYDKIEPVLISARQQHLVVESELWTQLLESEVNQRLFGIGRSQYNDAKARRHPGNTQGSKKPTGTGGRHQRAAEEQSGSTFPGRRTSKTATRKTVGVKIQMGDYPDDDFRPGTFDASGYVMLNRSHPCVLEDWEKRNTDGLIRVVAGIIANDAVWPHGTQGRFVYAEEWPPQERFLRLFGEFLANMRLVDGDE